MVRVERVEQAQQHVGLEARAAFHADRIADDAQLFDMRRTLKAGAVADPQEMPRGIVPAAGQAVLSRQRLLIGQERSAEHTSDLQSLMRNWYAVFCLEKKKQTK